MEAVTFKTPAPTAKLSDSQLVILNAAAQRADGSLHPFPQNLSIKGAALGKLVESLRKRKFVEEKKVTNGAPEWCRDEERRPLGLFITNAGLLALGVEDTEDTSPSQAAASMPRQRKRAAAKPRGNARKAPPKSKRRGTPSQSKQDAVIQMLRRRSGVTIKDIVTKTGWQPHSVRGFFSGLVKKKLKLPLTSEVGKDGIRRYHIAPLASAKA
jgi:hypothetical protein